MRVQNSIFIGEVFPIEVSDGLVHSLGSCQKVNLYPARVFTGARALRTLHTFRIRNDHSNVCSLVKYFQSRFPWKLSKSKLVSSGSDYGGTSFEEFVCD